MNERGDALIEQDTIHTAIIWVQRSDRNSGELEAINKRALLDIGDVATDSDAREIPTGGESGRANVSDAVRDRDATKRRAITESIARDRSEALGKCDICQADAMIESEISDVRDGVGYCDVEQIKALPECRTSYCADRKSIGGRGDSHNTTGAGILRNGNRAAVGTKGKLGVRVRCRQR